MIDYNVTPMDVKHQKKEGYKTYLLICYIKLQKTKWHPRMDNPEKLTTLVTQDT